MDNLFFPDAAMVRDVLEEGKVSRKIRARGGGLMMVEVFFETGGEGAEHRHPHQQVSYCLSGEFRFSLDGKTLYVSEQFAGRILAFDYDSAKGTATGRRTFATAPKEEGLPDGRTLPGKHTLPETVADYRCGEPVRVVVVIEDRASGDGSDA